MTSSVTTVGFPVALWAAFLGAALQVFTVIISMRGNPVPEEKAETDGSRMRTHLFPICII